MPWDWEFFPWGATKERLKNLTVQHIPGFILGPGKNISHTSIAEGFLDSLFHTKTADETFFKVLIIFLWTIAFLLILFTLLNVLLPTGRSNTKLIRFHIYLCELFYLMYILLSMINVALDFQLRSTLCDLANYGIYVTIPMMYIALLLLAIERAASCSGSNTILLRIATKSCVTQTILCFLWALSSVVIIAWATLKDFFKRMLFENRLTKAVKPAVDGIGNLLGRRSYSCSIDGRLPAGFKILLFTVLILILVAIVKPLITSIGAQRLIPSCCQRTKPKGTQHRCRATLPFIAILLLNVFLSFPFYMASIFTSVFSQFDSSETKFSKTLRISFLLRLLSIVFQCLAFYLLDEEPCPLIKKRINRAFGPGGCLSEPTRQQVNNGGESLVAKLKRKDSANGSIYTLIDPNTRRKPVSQRKVTIEAQSEIDSTEKLVETNQRGEKRSTDDIVVETKFVPRKPKVTNKPAPVERPTQKKRHVDGNNSDDLYASSSSVRPTRDDSAVSSSSERSETPPIRKKCVRSASSRPERIARTSLPTVLPKSRVTKNTP